MNIRHLFLAAAVILAAGAADAQPARPRENWIGAWGFAVVPPPPGVVMPMAAPAIVPLAPLQAAATPPTPLVENPGNVPVVVLTSDPGNEIAEVWNHARDMFVTLALWTFEPVMTE